ncbi:WG repeat-containing protein [Sinomicrobium weinanense]|uniref:WG repeat-containing protein n=1 Tax=Sinomicrobium weinanense TaxID=2842200 RepID=A0A926Q5J9_9FLAO|nr:WG repeat-containing protein [Sinomicrobium weinanense]MBC9798055.1 WG repeat-containing protein [Sinomicrobium weinanense]MBU3122532.1 WG repeat-containing protein [Sinomicrobium weinanense]
MLNDVPSKKPVLLLFAMLILAYGIAYSQTKDSLYNESLVPYKSKTGKWGYLDAASGRVVIPARYDKVGFFKGNTALVSNIDPNGASGYYYDKYLNGLIDTSGKELCPVEYTRGTPVRAGNRELEDLLKLENGKGSGIIRMTDGQWIIAPGEFGNGDGGYPNYICYDRERFLVNNRVYIDKGRKYKVPEGHRIDWVDRENQLFRITPLNNRYQKGISDWQGHIIVPAEYMEVSYYPENNRFIASKDNLLSQADKDLMTRVDEKGERNLNAADSLALKKLLEKMMAHENEDDKVENYLLDGTGKELARFYSRYFPTVTNGFITCEKAVTREHDYFSLEDGSPVSPGEAGLGHWRVFRENGLYGLADPEGNTVLSPKYQKMRFYGKDRIIATNPNPGDQRLPYLGVINTRGEEVIPFIYRQIHPMENGKHYIALDKEKKGYGVIDAKGNTVIPFIYKGHLSFTDGLAEVWDGKYQGVIDSLGNEILPLEFNTIFNTKTVNDTAEIYFTAKKDDKWGMFNRHGKQLIPVKYDYIHIADNYRTEEYSKDWVSVKDNDLYGLINIKTGVVISPEYTKILPFDKVIEVTLPTENDHKYRLMNLKGKPLGGPYEDITLKYGCFIAKKEGKYGLLSARGEVLLPFSYHSLLHVTPHLLKAERDNREFVVNLEGREYIVD